MSTTQSEAPRGPVDYTETTKPFDLIGFIIDYEDGELTQDQAVEGMQQLINSGLAWQLQGCYGRLAQQLIEAGLCNRPANS